MMPLHDILSIFFIILGTILILISAIGIIRLPDFYLRMSAITKAATLGLFLLLMGLAIYFNNLELSIKSFIIITLVLLTSPVGAHAISRAAYMKDIELWDGTVIDELKAMKDRKNELEKQLKATPDNCEIINELIGLYKALPTAQGGSLKKSEMMEKRLRE